MEWSLCVLGSGSHLPFVSASGTVGSALVSSPKDRRIAPEATAPGFASSFLLVRTPVLSASNWWSYPPPPASSSLRSSRWMEYLLVCIRLKGGRCRRNSASIPASWHGWCLGCSRIEASITVNQCVVAGSRMPFLLHAVQECLSADRHTANSPRATRFLRSLSKCVVFTGEFFFLFRSTK